MKIFPQTPIFLVKSLLRVIVVHRFSWHDFQDATLQRDNTKSEMSQLVRKMHRDLDILNQWIEPHSPWQNQAKINDV
jgi:hypothetical protein